MAIFVSDAHPVFRMGSSQTVSIASTSTASSATTAAVAGHGDDLTVTAYATADCFLAFGAAPTATSSSHFLAAGERMYFRMNCGDKIATIRKSGDGSLYLTELGT